ncbi:hypothetical protein G9A89_006766 [Geosiphon pyriformis]|nr:hypothetical protein G9A89_006766 [Geosiphon pyriformis]
MKNYLQFTLFATLTVISWSGLIYSTPIPLGEGINFPDDTFALPSGFDFSDDAPVSPPIFQENNLASIPFFSTADNVSPVLESIPNLIPNMKNFIQNLTPFPTSTSSYYSNPNSSPTFSSFFIPTSTSTSTSTSTPTPTPNTRISIPKAAFNFYPDSEEDLLLN